MTCDPRPRPRRANCARAHQLPRAVPGNSPPQARSARGKPPANSCGKSGFPPSPRTPHPALAGLQLGRHGLPRRGRRSPARGVRTTDGSLSPFSTRKHFANQFIPVRWPGAIATNSETTSSEGTPVPHPPPTTAAATRPPHPPTHPPHITKQCRTVQTGVLHVFLSAAHVCLSSQARLE